ncbi:MAG: hypothetical protein K0S61_3215, partial [Anaerocolumna sp.]|nr:hypothetical protein [Anaerocolumna sp.]
MSDNFFDKEVSKEPWIKKEENENVSINSQQANLDETLGEDNTAINKETNSEPGIFERNSKIGNDINQMNSSYSFWAEQIASASSDNAKDDPYKNPFLIGYLDEQAKKFSQNGGYTPNGSGYTSPEEKERTKKKSPVGRFAKFILGAAVFGVIAGGAFIGFNSL